MAQSNESKAGFEDEDSPQLHVLDLPQLHTKPSTSCLLAVLSQLALKPSSWDTDQSNDSHTSLISEDGIPAYLTRIIMSPMDWISTGADKEHIWEEASKRLAERSGRTAMGSVDRVFEIPLHSTKPKVPKSVKIKIHEPTLTEDNLGHKTWAASYLLAKRLPISLPAHQFPFAFDLLSPGNKRPRVLELGAGTGLVGLTAASFTTAQTHLTDLPHIESNLEKNRYSNQRMWARANSLVTCGVLDWSNPPSKFGPRGREQYDIILAADSLYAPEHAEWLASTMALYLERATQSRIFTELPLRPGSSYPADFSAKMEGIGFKSLESAEDLGRDDWQDASGQEVEVRCRYEVWGWASLPSS